MEPDAAVVLPWHRRDERPRLIDTADWRRYEGYLAEIQPCPAE